MRSSTRRDALKAVAGASIGAGLAGCFGQNGGTPTSGGGDGIEGVTFEYWDFFGSQSEASRQGMEQFIQEFENDTGATVNVNWSNTSAMLGGQWRNTIRQGRRPVAYSASSLVAGQFIDPGWLKPVDEYIDVILEDDELRSAVEPSFEKAQPIYRGWEQDLYEVPMTLSGTLFLARADHFEQAGLSIEDDYPPESYDDLIQIATQLQEDGPADYGFQIYGDPGDLMGHALSDWTAAESGTDGMAFNEDWSDVNFDNDVWKAGVEQYVDVFQELGLSDPSTVSQTDEGAAQLVIAGDVSMTQINMQTHGVVLDNGEDLLNDGTLRYGACWNGPMGRGDLYTNAVGIMRPPQNANADQWARKQEAAMEFVKRMLGRDFQENALINAGGGMPSRQDVYEDISGRPHELIEAAQTHFSDVNYAWESHPQQVAAQLIVPGGEIQQAVQGEVTPAEACENAASAVRSQFPSIG